MYIRFVRLLSNVSSNDVTRDDETGRRRALINRATARH